MTDRTFSLSEVERLVPEMRDGKTVMFRLLRHLSPKAHEANGKGGRREYTLTDVAVVRAWYDTHPFCENSARGSHLRHAILNTVTSGRDVDLEVNGLRVIYRPRWVTDVEASALPKPQPTGPRSTGSRERVECLICHEMVALRVDGRLRWHRPNGGLCLGSRKPVSWLPEDDRVEATS